MPLGSRGGTSVRHRFPVDGEYEISVGLQRGRFDRVPGARAGTQARPAARRSEARTVHHRGRCARGPADSRHRDATPMRISRSACPVKAGTRTLVATFLKDTVSAGRHSAEPARGGLLRRRRQHFGCRPLRCARAGRHARAASGFSSAIRRRPPRKQACAEKIIANLAHRAYRRPIAADDLPPLLALYRQGAASGGFEAGVRLALQKILVSPEFIFRMEFDPPDAAPGSVHRISDVELASRLSFFLWSSIPDDELLAVAERGELERRGGPGAPGPAHAGRSALAGSGDELRRPMAVLAQYREDTAGPGGLPEFRRESAPGARAGDASSWSKARCARIAASSIC